jgi:hypothetical protein
VVGGVESELAQRGSSMHHHRHFTKACITHGWVVVCGCSRSRGYRLGRRLVDSDASRGFKITRSGCDGIVVLGPGSVSTPSAATLVTLMARLIILPLHHHTVSTKDLPAITTVMLASYNRKFRLTGEATGGIPVIHPVLPSRLGARVTSPH